MENAKKDLTDLAKGHLKGKRVDVYYGSPKEKYSKNKSLFVYKGYDMLEDIFSVRTFIQKLYGIDFSTLELLLKMMGMKLFKRHDYYTIPKSYSFFLWNKLIESGYVTIVMDANKTDDRIFTLSHRSKKIVTDFYAYLFGEKKIPMEQSKNPMVDSGVSFDKYKLKVLKQLNELEVPEHKKFLFD